MLRWRLLIGTFLVAALAGLFWLDVHAERPGAYLAPLAVAASLLAAGEIMRLGRARGVAPHAVAVYVGAALPVLACVAPIVFGEQQNADAVAGVANLSQLGWLAGGLIAGLVVALLVEMRRFEQPGGATASLAHAALGTLYVGGLLGMLVQLRLIRGDAGPLGLIPLASMIAAVKLSDTCQYFVGKSCGRTKLAPRLSPGKTWEGTLGGIGVAVTLVAIALPLLVGDGGLTAARALRWGGYALAVAIAGLQGDLGESLLKRDAGVKDSSDWLPGFGGVLDMLDSLLLAAPVAYLCWARGLPPL
ncbi:MAG: phosphatidate cytidylyltransferase [Planctomycetales bacterium]|nr:phosphatidate cytidylyltransferase [Planctomycetales bacterium]